MKKYIHANDDWGYGFDSDGKAIDQSTVEELYRIADQDILPMTELGQMGAATIEEDSFEYHFGGGINGASLTYTIYFETDDENLDLMSFVKRNAKFYPDFRSEKYSAKIRFNIHVHLSNIKVEFLEADVYENGVFSDYFSDDFREDFDWKRMQEIVKEIAEPAVDAIHQALSAM